MQKYANLFSMDYCYSEHPNLLSSFKIEPRTFIEHAAFCKKNIKLCILCFKILTNIDINSYQLNERENKMSREYRTKMSGTVAEEIRQEITEFEKHLSQLTGTKAEFGNATYDDNEVTFKLTFRLNNAKTKEAEALERFIKYYVDFDERKQKLDPKKIGTHNGKSYMLIGYKPRARKKPFMVKLTTVLLSDTYYAITENEAFRLFGVSK